MNALARDLWEARRLGRTIDASRNDLPETKEDAFAVQEAILELSGLERVGYKVGSTSKEAQRLLNTDEPGRGPLLASYVFASPARIPIVPEQAPQVEGEFAFRLGKDLPAREGEYAMSDVTAAIESVAGVIEVVGTRFAGGLPGKGRLLTTADCGVNIALAVGEWTAFRGQDLREHPVAMSINGEAKGSGTGSRALGDPLNVLLWLANQQIDLKAGEIIATGTCTGLDPVEPGDVASADFGTLGAVTIELVSE